MNTYILSLKSALLVFVLLAGTGGGRDRHAVDVVYAPMEAEAK